MLPPGNTRNARRRLRALVVAGAAAGCVALGAMPVQAAQAAGCARAWAVAGEAARQTLAQTTLCLINVERAKRGIAPLRLNSRLSRAAAGHSRDMVRRRYFSHTTPSGVTFADRIRRTGYLGSARSWTIGENIDWGTEDFSSAAGALHSWMHSPPHRANILRRSFREIGIGVAFGTPSRRGHPAATYTTDFGAKL